MSLLRPINSPVESEANQVMAASGGLWAVPADADRGEVVSEVRERGLRALAVDGDVAFVEHLPNLEFLIASRPPSVEPVTALRRLRLLSFSAAWGGRLDGPSWPQLEWFTANEPPTDGGGIETVLSGSPTLRRVNIGRYRGKDFTIVDAPALESLEVSNSRSVERLDGLQSVARSLTALDLALLPNLRSLDGLQALTGLEVLKLGGLRHITTLDEVARLPRLRFLGIIDLKSVASLRPLESHPTLEYLAFGPTADLDLDPLFTIPNLKLVLTGEHRWNRDIHSLPYWHDVPSDDARRVEWGRLTLR